MTKRVTGKGSSIDSLENGLETIPRVQQKSDEVKLVEMVIALLSIVEDCISHRHDCSFFISTASIDGLATSQSYCSRTQTIGQSSAPGFNSYC